MCQTASDVNKFIDDHIGDLHMIESLADFFWVKRDNSRDKGDDYNNLALEIGTLERPVIVFLYLLSRGGCRVVCEDI